MSFAPNLGSRAGRGRNTWDPSGRVLIAEALPDGSTTSFIFSSIPVDFRGLEIDFHLNGGINHSLRFNGDSSGVYQHQRTGHMNGAVNSQLLTQTSALINSLAAIGMGRILLYNYNQATQVKHAQVQLSVGSTGSGSLGPVPTAVSWNNTTSVINRIDFICGSAPATGVGFVRLFGCMW